MSFLRGSANYVWCTTSVLGKGATGAVFQGVNKATGEPVAVKTFNQLSHLRPQDVQMREFEVLKKVNHENIVKLLDIEDDQEGRGKVIVMELCTGGSLFNILDDPENTYGLQEKEFLLVVEHLSAGMKHLHDNNIVHRDLKPGNIMKFICDDGTTVYKLTDFGAARELSEGQQFVSLYGTEEYLHPDMYERAVLRKPVSKTFGASVDLWSIGVTLYHVATGSLPFRPFGGRRNKETMFHITTKKASGVISGIQTSENGTIEWSRELPENCQLSAGLKKVVTPLIAGLLEVDQQRIWSFDRFFSEVTRMISCKEINIFHVNKAASIKVFIHPDDIYEQLQAHITEQTNIPAESQILLLKNKLVLDVVEETTLARGYPLTKEEEPLMLFSKENNNVVLEFETDVPKFPVFPNLVSVENDASQAKVACSVGHECKRRIEKLSLSSRLIKDCVDHFTQLINNDLSSLYKKCQHLTETTHCIEETAKAVERSQDSIETLLNILTKDSQQPANWSSKLSVISQELLQNGGIAVQQLYQKNVAENTLRLEWETSSRGLKCPYQSRASARARTLVDRLRDSWQHLLRDRATRTLTYNDEQFHLLERIKVAETGRRLKFLLENECSPAIKELAEALGDWYKIAQTVYLQTMILNKDIDVYEQKLDKFSTMLYVGNETYLEKLSERVRNVGGQPYKNKTTSAQRRTAKAFKDRLENVIEVNADIKNIAQETAELIQTLQQLTQLPVEKTFT